MARLVRDIVPDNLSDTEEMEDIEYDSDSTNMSVSRSSESRDAVANEADGSDREGDESDEIRIIEHGSPVIGERRLQDGVVLSQRIRTPVLDDGITAVERVRTPAIVEPSDSSEEEDEELFAPSPEPALLPRGVRLVERNTSSSSSSSTHSESRQSPVPESLNSLLLRQLNDDINQSNLESRVYLSPMEYMFHMAITREESMNRRPSPLPGPSTDSRLLLLPGQSTSDNRLSPLPGQSTSDSRLSPLPGQSSSHNRQPLVPGQSSSVISHSTEPGLSTSDVQAHSGPAQHSTVNRSPIKAKPSGEETPKKKSAAAEVPGSPESDDEGQICSICFEPWANSGAHRLASLKCGHIFGNSCIERWLKGQGGKCPQCNAKATKKDIRVLYAKSLKVLDTTERDRAVNELEKEKEARRRLELEHAQTKLQYDLKSQMVTKLQNELKMLRNAASGSSMNMSQGMGSSQGNKSKLVIHSGLDLLKDGGCRVMAYNDWLDMVVVSMPTQVTMFPGYGIKRINMLDIKAERYIPIHQKQLRDMAFNPAKNDLLLTVGMDKWVKLTNICNNFLVGSFSAEAPLWSCCWNIDQPNQFFVGTAIGSVVIYDTRTTTGPIQTFKVTGSGPVVSMCYVPFSAGSNFGTGGLLVARLSSCSFVVVKDDGTIQDNPLLLDGPFTSVSFERSTRHFMVSCRPSQKYPHARHLVCVLQKVDISNDAAALNQVITANVIQTFRGGTTQKVLSRSCLIVHPLQPGTILACASDESTQSTCIWDVSSGTCLQQLRCKETIIDIIPIKSNQSAYLALLTEKAVKFYKWVDLLL